jgi:hypothetical protein
MVVAEDTITNKAGGRVVDVAAAGLRRKYG